MTSIAKLKQIMNAIHYLLRFHLTAVLLFFAFQGSAATLHQPPPKLFGRNIETRELFTLQSVKQTPIVLNFFWNECLPCILELPHLALLEAQFPYVTFIAVHSGINTSTEKNYTPEAVKRFIASLPSSPKTIIWSSAQTLKKHWEINHYPATILINQDHTIEHILLGYNPTNLTRLNQWLKKQKLIQD